MTEHDRKLAVIRLLHGYLRSPSLKHLREPDNIRDLATEIIKAVDLYGGRWAKWVGDRELLAKAAIPYWIPLDDFREYLNCLPGQPLTATDVRQRIAEMAEEGFEWPNDDYKTRCLEIYEREKAAGTEMPAIIREICDQLDVWEQVDREALEEAWQRSKQQARTEHQARLRAGLDCGWIDLDQRDIFYCRLNNRLFRITRDKQKRWELVRINALEDSKGLVIGHYNDRKEANKVIRKVAFEIGL